MSKQWISADQLVNFGWKNINNAMIDDLNNALVKYEINTPDRIAHFMSQCGHESGLGLYTKELASGASYEGRSDLGNVLLGDGPRFKGAGYIQLTGRANYQRFSNHIDDAAVMQGVDYVATKYPWSSAGFWWANAGMNQLADGGATVQQITRRVNGGYNGLENRMALYQRWIYQNKEAEEVKLDAGVANTIIDTWISPAWNKADEAGDEQTKTYVKWLANQLRLASSQPEQ
ncbi:glycoside hydrolase family 19 protein [Paenibacillus elgii]|uniref:glycoside hydrolase family 19 protein n=1 Tax=Paenibacillus elgii TaxID=189691 RepID=UPI000248C654|nr:hypothetical protein [Paenibacillus elgii]